MPKADAVFTPDTFKFFRELARNNRTDWMEANRERYRGSVVAPLRTLLERLAPVAQKLNPQFDISGRQSSNFSRINRDIRFAKDKTPYRTQMYLKFSALGSDEDAQLYVGVSGDAVTAGFRIYFGGRESALAQIAIPRAQANAKWLVRQARRLRKKYDSYWYGSEKGEWKKHDGWPTKQDEWKRLKGWVVRRKMKPAAAARAGFVTDAGRIFRDVFPLWQFTSGPKVPRP